MSRTEDETGRIRREEILNAAILLREEDPAWTERISAGVIGRVRRRRRRNARMAAVFTLVLSAGIGAGVYYDGAANPDDYTNDPYLSLYESIYEQTESYGGFGDDYLE